jgi:CBS domain-containing protein
MDGGPTTVRPDATVDALRTRLRDAGLETAIVTTPEGRLLGVVLSADLAEDAAAQPTSRRSRSRRWARGADRA